MCPSAYPPILTHLEARKLVDALRSDVGSVEVSLDLGLSQTEVQVRHDRPVLASSQESDTGSYAIDESSLRHPVDGAGHEGAGANVISQHGLNLEGRIISLATLEKIASESRKCFEVTADGESRPISVFSEVTGWVRTLCPTTEAPTTIVAGFPMHRIKDTTPLADTRSKVATLVRPRNKVLDTATGLGYTAIELSKTAAEVVTVEVDPAAIELARRNPWSSELFTSRNIRIITGDVNDVADTFADGEFAAILHDPPTMQLAGDLYSGVFYRKLRRILRKGGRLFHYVGDLDSKTGARTARGVADRLREAGFTGIERSRQSFGIIAAA